MISPRGLGMALLCFGTLCRASDGQRTNGHAVTAGPAVCQNASCIVPTEAEAHDSAMSMLQRRRQGTGQQRTGGPVALALQGGGWYSVTLFSGWFAGMIYWLNRLDAGKPLTFEGSGLFKEVTLITSVSGGSWTAAGLIYSPYFMATVEQLAQLPEFASVTWNKRWTTRLLDKDFTIAVSDVLLIIKECVLGTIMDPNQIDNDWVFAFTELLVSALDSAGSRQLFENLIIFTYFFFDTQVGDTSTQVFTWREFVLSYMQKVCDITETNLMGDTPNAWANGKVWMPAIVQLNPARGNRVYSYYKQLVWVPITEYLSYKLKQAPGMEPTCPGAPLSPDFAFWCYLQSLLAPDWAQADYGPHLYPPARFSVTLGGGHDQSAPFPWCPDDNICPNRRLEYWGRTRDWPFWPQVVPAPKTQGEFSQQAIDANAGKVPVMGAISGSSSAAGLASLFALPVFNPICSLSSMSVSMADDAEGDIFQAGRNFLIPEKQTLVSGTNLKTPDLLAGANMMYQMIADAAYADNTGIMTAVGAGATTIFALFSMEGDFYTMFPRADRTLPEYEKYHVFKEDYLEAYQNVQKGTDLDCGGPGGKCSQPLFQYLRRIRYGQMTATKDVSLDAREFGVTYSASGDTVTLHWVWMPSLIGILEPLVHGTNDGSAENLADSYDTLMQEVINVLIRTENEVHVQAMLTNIGALSR